MREEKKTAVQTEFQLARLFSANTEKTQPATRLVSRELGRAVKCSSYSTRRFYIRSFAPPSAFSSCLIAARHLSALLFFRRQAARQRHVTNPPQNDGASLSLVNPSDISQNKTVKRPLGFRIRWQRRGLAAGIVNCGWLARTQRGLIH